jgi:hypothetical protein
MDRATTGKNDTRRLRGLDKGAREHIERGGLIGLV